MAASKPTSQLSLTLDLFCPFTLSLYFGTLTLVWVVPLLDSELTPEALAPDFYDDRRFGV